MMKLILSHIFLLFLIVGNSQVFIADAETKEVLPFAVVKVLHTAFAVYSDSNGMLDINNITPIDTLLIEYSGYERKKTSGIKNADTIFLKSAAIELPAVDISAKGLMVEKKIGVFKYYGGNQMLYGESQEVAKKLTIPAHGNGEYKIQKIYLPLGIAKVKNPDLKFIVKIHLYNVRNGLPDADILKTPIALDANTVHSDSYYDISDQHIFSRDSIFFLGVEILIFDKNKEVLEQKIEEKNARKYMKIAEQISPLRLFTRHGRDLVTINVGKFFCTRDKHDPDYKWKGNSTRGLLFSGGIIIQVANE